MTQNTLTSRPAAVAEPEQRRVIAGLADGTVETVADLHLRGRADEIAAELREQHLPALEEAGYIEWDREAGTIKPGPNFEEAAAHVDDLPTPDVAATDPGAPDETAADGEVVDGEVVDGDVAESDSPEGEPADD
jgi:hypothetical protein